MKPSASTRRSPKSISAPIEPSSDVERQDIHTYYGDGYILQGVTLELQPGQIVALLGRNGVGKTTLVRSIIGLTPARRGRILFKDNDITRMPAHRIARMGIGLVPQGRHVFRSLTVMEHLQVTARGRGQWDFARIIDLFPNLHSRLRSLAGKLSSGEQQMLAAARALIGNPALLLMDEPTEGLAPMMVRLGRTIASLKHAGTSILLVSSSLPLRCGTRTGLYHEQGPYRASMQPPSSRLTRRRRRDTSVSRIFRSRVLPPNASDPANKAVIVTGGARGLGRAMTLALMRSDVRVAVADLPASAAELRELSDIAGRELQDRLLCIECDVTQWQDCVGAVKRPPIIRCGARARQQCRRRHAAYRQCSGRAPQALLQVDADTWRGAIDVNLNGPFMMARAIAPSLIEQGWGRIVNIVTSFFTMMMDGFSPYGPSKAALEAATVIWSKDLAGSGVTVNALLPGGPANTRMIPQSEVADRATLVQPEVMMAPIVWLMSARSDGITGRRIIAKEWDAQRLERESPERVGTPAGW